MMWEGRQLSPWGPPTCQGSLTSLGASCGKEAEGSPVRQETGRSGSVGTGSLCPQSSKMCHPACRCSTWLLVYHLNFETFICWFFMDIFLRHELFLGYVVYPIRHHRFYFLSRHVSSDSTEEGIHFFLHHMAALVEFKA